MRILKIMLLGGTLLSCSDAEVTSPPELRRLNETSPVAAGVPVARVYIDPYSTSIQAGQTAQLGVRLYDANGVRVTGRQVAWSTNKAFVATVNEAGLVNGVAAGLATITASIDGANGYAAVRVSGVAPAPVPVASVSVSPATASMAVGETRQLTSTTLDANNNVLTGRAVAWSTSDASVANVNSSGLVTAVAAGSATVTATSEGRAGTSAITVTVPTPIIARVAVTPENSSLEQGQTIQLHATAQNSSGQAVPGQTFGWTSSNSGVASVNGSGLIMAVSAGTATITASTGGVSGTATITVTVPPPPTPTVTNVSVAPATGNIQQGQTIQLNATARDANGNVMPGQTFSWTSDNSGIATVNSSGLVMAVGAGTATITASVSGVSGSATITVTVPPPPPPTVSSVSVSPATAGLQPGQTIQVTATARTSSGTIVSGQTFTWTSSNSAVASVNANGLVTAAAAGIATITATTSGVSGSASITVTAPPPPPSGSARVLFQSDWRAMTGNTVLAISDGGKWNSISAGASSNGSIITAPAGFSTHNVLRVRSDGTRDGWLAPTVTTLGEIPIGSTRNYRWEHAFHEPSVSDHGQHPIQDGGSASSSNWYLSTVNGGGNLQDGQWALEWGFWGNSNWGVGEYVLGARDGQWTPLTKGVVYRIELQVVRVSATQFRFHTWIHDSAGNLLYDDDDFHSRDGSSSLAQNPLQSFNIPANSTNFVIGLNGIANAPWPIHSSDQAAFAVVQGLAERQQIGAYGSVAGEIRR